MPTPVQHSPPRARALWHALICGLITFSLSACGGEQAESAETHAAPARLAVVRRDLAFARDASLEAPPAHSLSWSFEQQDAAWSAEPGTSLDTQDGALRARSAKQIALVGPHGNVVDPELQHHLVLRLRNAKPLDVIVYWRGSEAEAFDESRRTVAQSLEAADEFRLWSIPLANLRGWRTLARGEGDEKPRWIKGKDATEGLQALRLVFEDPDDGTVDVEIDSIALSSTFDGEPGQPLPPSRMGREHVFHTGVALAVPDKVSAPIEPDDIGRLRFWLAAAGAPAGVRVRVSDTSGRLPAQEWELEPDAPWLPVSIDLAPFAGEPGELVVETLGGGARGAVMLGGLMQLAPASTERPNVIFYLEDTLRADHLQTYGYTKPTDPHLLGIAEQGVVFENLFAAANWTRPSTTSLLTSLDPLTHGNHADADRISTGLTTLAEVMADAGYVTASIVTNYHAGTWSGLEQGFDSVREPPADGAATLMSTLTSAVIADPLDALLEEHADEQLFIYVHTLDPHSPYLPPEIDLDAIPAAISKRPPAIARALEEERAYDAEVRHNDHQLARLDATLTRLGMLDDTLFLFTSDHGEGFMEHGQRSHRTDLFQEELHVPWVMRWAAGLPAGHRVDVASGHIDVAPTMLGLIGIEPPTSWRGRDLSGLARQLPGRVEDTPLLVYTTYGRAPENGTLHALAVVRWPFKLTAWVTPRSEVQPRGLYRLDEDPKELHNLIEEPARQDLIVRMREWAEGEIERASTMVDAVPATHMDPAMLNWLEEMGYLGK